MKVKLPPLIYILQLLQEIVIIVIVSYHSFNTLIIWFLSHFDNLIIHYDQRQVFYENEKENSNFRKMRLLRSIIAIIIFAIVVIVIRLRVFSRWYSYFSRDFFGSRKIPLGKFPPIKLPTWNPPSENSQLENSHLEYSHSFH